MALKRKFPCLGDAEKTALRLVEDIKTIPVADLWSVWQPFYGQSSYYFVDRLFDYVLDFDKTGATESFLRLTKINQSNFSQFQEYFQILDHVVSYQPNREVTPSNFNLTIALFGCRQFAVKMDRIGLYRGITQKLNVSPDLSDSEFALLLATCSMYSELVSVIYRDTEIYIKTGQKDGVFKKEGAHKVIERKASVIPLPSTGKNALFATCNEHEVQIMESPQDCWRRFYDTGEEKLFYAFFWPIHFSDLTRLGLYKLDLRNNWFLQIAEMKQLHALHLSHCCRYFIKPMKLGIKELWIKSHQDNIFAVNLEAQCLDILVMDVYDYFFNIPPTVTYVKIQLHIRDKFLEHVMAKTINLLELDITTDTSGVFKLDDFASKNFRTFTVNGVPMFRDQRHARAAKVYLRKKFVESNFDSLLAHSLKPLIPLILYAAFNTTSPTLRYPIFSPFSPFSD